MSPHVDEQLSAYLDEELDGLTRQRISVHLEGCDRCSARLAELAALDALSREAEIEAPDGYFETLPGRIRERLGKRTAPRWVAPRWTWAAAAAALIAVLAPLTMEQGADITPEAGQSSRARAPRAAEPPATLAKQTQDPQRQIQMLDEAVPGAAGDAKQDAEGRVALAAPPTDRLELKAAPAALAARRAEPAVNQPAPRPKAKERAHAARKRSPAATPAPAATAPAGLGSTVAEAPADSDDVAETETVVHEEEGLETREQDAMARTSGKVVSQGRRDHADVRAAVGGLTTAEALRTPPADAESVDRLRLERERLRLEVRDEADADAADKRRVRIIELGVRIYLMSAEPRDLSVAQDDIRSYLATPDAPGAARVRELERELSGR